MKPTTPPKDTAETWEEKYDRFIRGRAYFIVTDPDDPRIGINAREAIKALFKQELAHLLEEVEGVIGEDEQPKPGHRGNYKEFVDTRNWVRAEQRKALTQLRKKYLGL